MVSPWQLPGSSKLVAVVLVIESQYGRANGYLMSVTVAVILLEVFIMRFMRNIRSFSRTGNTYSTWDVTYPHSIVKLGGREMEFHYSDQGKFLACRKCCVAKNQSPFTSWEINSGWYLSYITAAFITLKLVGQLATPIVPVKPIQPIPGFEIRCGINVSSTCIFALGRTARTDCIHVSK